MAFTVKNISNGDVNISGLVLAKGTKKVIPFLTKPIQDAVRAGVISMTPDVTGVLKALTNGASAYASVDGIVPNPTDVAKTQIAVGTIVAALNLLTSRFDSLEQFIRVQPMPQDGAVKR